MIDRSDLAFTSRVKLQYRNLELRNKKLRTRSVNRNMPVRSIFELPEGFDQLGQTQLNDLCIRLEAGIKEIIKEREEDAKSLIAIKQCLGECEKLLDKTKVELNSHKLDAEREDANTLNKKVENLVREKESTQDEENKKLIIDEKDLEITTFNKEKEEVEKLLKQSEEECSNLKGSLDKVKKEKEEPLKSQNYFQEEFNAKESELISLPIKYNHLNLELEQFKVSRNELLDKKQDAEFELQLEKEASTRFENENRRLKKRVEYSDKSNSSENSEVSQSESETSTSPSSSETESSSLSTSSSRERN
ncbi:hypothetical protein BpHYR1_053715 [Brachionus plicatilis]|uniref:Uncharacterized protein n=1 Tax=Brachionus plicatilis TaxID=10195 RepID=A0A3M7S2E2_BRAPC|nr:hypothetical protein BpHYR1_053715 [Brachionus plicatilis]